jgi:hypothetical protein
MNNNGGGQDYLDKAFNMVARKFGGAQGTKIANDRAKSEKIVRPPYYHVPFLPRFFLLLLFIITHLRMRVANIYDRRMEFAR